MTQPLQTTRRRPDRTHVRRLPALLFALIAVVALLSLFVPPNPAMWWLGWVIPLDQLDTSQTLTVLAIVGFAMIALGLLRSGRVSWRFPVAILAVALFVQASALAHPLRVVVVGGVLAVLVADRRRYSVAPRLSWKRVIPGVVLIALLAVGAETALLIAATGSWPTPLAALSGATAALGGLFGVNDDLAGSVLRLVARTGLVVALLAAARLPIALGALGVLVQRPEPRPDPSVRSRALDVARRHGRGALLPFQLGEDKFLHCPPGLDACVVYGLVGRSAIALGDPIASHPVRASVVAGFLERCRELDRNPAFYQVTQGMRPILLDAGFELFRIGDEAIVDLATFDLSGSRRANLRHTLRRAQRGGLQVRWFPDGMRGPDAEPRIDGLVALNHSWRKRAGPRLGFTISQFNLDDILKLPVALATDAAGRTLAFTTYRPTGSDHGWVLDLMRRAPDSIPGAVEACIAEAALAFQAMGSPTLSLGLAPLAGLKAGAGRGGQGPQAVVARLVRPWYDIAGLTFFKGKFDPRWEPRYAAVPSKWHMPGLALALLRLHLRPDRRRCAAGNLTFDRTDVAAEAVEPGLAAAPR